MSIGVNKVQVLKQESTALGGTDSDDNEFLNNPIDAQGDAIEVAGVYLNDGSNRDSFVYVARAGDDGILRDKNNTTPFTFSSLARGGTVSVNIAAMSDYVSGTVTGLPKAPTRVSGLKVREAGVTTQSGMHYDAVVDSLTSNGFTFTVSVLGNEYWPGPSSATLDVAYVWS